MKIVILIILIFLSFSITNVYAQKSISISDTSKIFLENGELYLLNGDKIIKLTNTNNKVQNFDVSPNRNIIAFEKELYKVEKGAELEVDGKIPLVSISSIVFFDIELKRTIKEIHPNLDKFLEMGEWLSNNYFGFLSAGFYDVSGVYIYDIITDSIIDTHYDFDKWNEYRNTNSSEPLKK